MYIFSYKLVNSKEGVSSGDSLKQASIKGALKGRVEM